VIFRRNDVVNNIQSLKLHQLSMFNCVSSVRYFDACSRINQWSENEKGLYLAVALRGQAQGILGDLPIDKQQDYKSLVKALEERSSIKCCFASVSRTFSGTVG
jgi:hypothetical protein